MGPPSSIPCFRLIFSRARFPMRWSHRARLREIIKEMAGRSFWPAFFDCPLPGSSFCTLSNVWAVMRLAGVVLPPPPDSAYPPGPELLVLESKGRHLHLSGLRLPFVRPSVRPFSALSLWLLFRCRPSSSSREAQSTQDRSDEPSRGGS